MSADAKQPTQSRRPLWTQHAKDMWTHPRRNDCTGQDVSTAWQHSVTVDYPSARDGACGRYHQDGDCVLIVKRDTVDGVIRPIVVTVINLTDRPPWEQAYVRCQAQYGGAV